MISVIERYIRDTCYSFLSDLFELEKDLERIQSQISNDHQPSVKPIYRIICKTETNLTTTMTSNAILSMRLIGEQSTPFFPLQQQTQLKPGSIIEYLHRDKTHITDVRQRIDRYKLFNIISIRMEVEFD